MAVGLFLIVIEIFIPGGVVGFLGSLSLVAAVITGFYAFGPNGGMISAIGTIILGSLVLLIWLKLFPKTLIGRHLTLQTDGKSFKSFEDDASLIGSEGTALSHLRPAGIASINGKRLDVVSEAGFIENGASIKVIKIEGNRIVVRALKS